MTEDVSQTTASPPPEALPDDADAYQVARAFSRALDAAPSDRTLLRAWSARFPEFEDELITVGYGRWALGLTLTDTAADYVADYVADYDAEEEGRAEAARPPLAGLASEALALGLDVADFARSLRLDRTLLLRLDQRAVVAVPRALTDRIARTLGRTRAEVAAFLRAAPRLAPATHYKARRAPSLVAEGRAARPTFADEVRRSTKLTDDDRAYWLGEAGQDVLEELPEESLGDE